MILKSHLSNLDPASPPPLFFFFPRVQTQIGLEQSFFLQFPEITVPLFHKSGFKVLHRHPHNMRKPGFLFYWNDYMSVFVSHKMSVVETETVTFSDWAFFFFFFSASHALFTAMSKAQMQILQKTDTKTWFTLKEDIFGSQGGMEVWVRWFCPVFFVLYLTLSLKAAA